MLDGKMPTIGEKLRAARVLSCLRGQCEPPAPVPSFGAGLFGTLAACLVMLAWYEPHALLPYALYPLLRGWPAVVLELSVAALLLYWCVRLGRMEHPPF